MNKRFYIGLTLQILAVLIIIGAAQPAFYYVGYLIQIFIAGPIFIVGSIYVFKSHIHLLFKILLSFWWLCFPLNILVQYGLEELRSKPKVFLVPDNYRGEVIIYFNRPDGEEPTLKDGKLFFKVHPDGTLKSRYQPVKMKYHDADYEFGEVYYIDSLKKMKLIKSEDSSVKDQEVAIRGGGMAYDPQNKFITEIDFYIGTIPTNKE